MINLNNKWIQVSVGGDPKLLNLDNFWKIEPDPANLTTKSKLHHNDMTTTVIIDAAFDIAVVFFQPLFYKVDALQNPL